MVALPYALQVILNIKLQSTSGQSTISVIITVVGKTMDFLVTYGLEMPLEYVIMCYFSSSTAFINGFQVQTILHWKWKYTMSCMLIVMVASIRIGFTSFQLPY